ncbi:ATP-binding cassette domain-containing protein [Alphaproteobacteria bacterium]|nr:ATP-binding cassette domain-containing protein [Alphaproteobacteria bacterium]
MSEINLYEAKNVTKRYGNLTALDSVDFHIAPREVVGLLGDNGAGKSTLIKMMSGVVEPNQGSVFVEGKETKIKNRKESEELAGIETIYQNSALCDDMTIVRNIFMGREITNSLGFMNHKKMEEISTEVLTSGVEIAGIDSPNKEIGALSGGQKQAVAIARAVYFKRKILLLDEPTSALSVRETEKVLNYVTDLKKENVSSVIVTHNLYHAFQVCDRFVVMSHGKVVFEKSKQETNIEEVTEQVIKV